MRDTVRSILHHANSDHHLVRSLFGLIKVMDENKIILLLERSKLLKVIYAIGSGACTIEGLVETLDRSRSSVYRSLESIEEILPDVIIRDGVRSSLISIDKNIPYMDNILELARILYPMEIRDLTNNMALRELTTIRSRIILHLYQYPPTVDAYNSPVESTRRFLTKVANTSHPVVSRELNELIQMGYLEKTRSRVPGSKVKENAYLLTYKGSTEGMRLFDKARRVYVYVIDMDGAQVRVPLTEILKMSRVRIDLCDVLYAANGTTSVLDRISHSMISRSR